MEDLPLVPVPSTVLAAPSRGHLDPCHASHAPELIQITGEVERAWFVPDRRSPSRRRSRHGMLARMLVRVYVEPDHPHRTSAWRLEITKPGWLTLAKVGDQVQFHAVVERVSEADLTYAHGVRGQITGHDRGRYPPRRVKVGVTADQQTVLKDQIEHLRRAGREAVRRIAPTSTTRG